MAFCAALSYAFLPFPLCFLLFFTCFYACFAFFFANFFADPCFPFTAAFAAFAFAAY